MVLFFHSESKVYAIEAAQPLSTADVEKLIWLLGNAQPVAGPSLEGFFIGPRKEMITPWSTNAVEITQNMGISGITRLEEFAQAESAQAAFDPMLSALYQGLDQEVFNINKQPEPIVYIDDIAAYNAQESLALSEAEISYLEETSQRIGRKLTDSEVFGFSQVNSEHCRHKIFNGVFVIDGEEKPHSLFQLIKKTSHANPGNLVSAYKDNVAFIKGPRVQQFAPRTHDKADFFETKEIDTVISLKAETHNFPTTVEPFNGAATGSGGEIRDRMAGGRGSIPLAGTAVYMTPYSRLEDNRPWEQHTQPRPWRYQTPIEILIKASNGASDFGNKFGQPLICGSVLTFEHKEGDKMHGFDKVVMLAGGIGFGRMQDSLKNKAEVGDKVVVMGGDNYRIGMGGGAVSSVATGEFAKSIELNAVQRSNPEMQKRVYNAIRAMAESDENPIVSIHDHGAGGHLNCLSELVEEQGGHIDMDQLPVGDPTLSAKEIIGNESQERMGLLMKPQHIEWMKRVAERERAPFYVVGHITGDKHLTFESQKKQAKPIDLKLDDMFGKAPRTIMRDKSIAPAFKPVSYKKKELAQYLHAVLQLEAVACKDWLTNKVDRSVTGRVAMQQTAGAIQLPLNNLGIMALDYQGQKGIATSIGHAPAAALVDPQAGSQIAVAEALTNIVWAPLQEGLSGVSLSANWMWPCKNEGEDARLYAAVEALSNFACALGVNVPTGKDSLSMTQKYPSTGQVVYSPGTVVVSAVAEVSDLKKAVSPALRLREGSTIIYINASCDRLKLGGSSFAQVLGQLGDETPEMKDAAAFRRAFAAIQQLIEGGQVLAGHDIGSGGLITSLLEMCFATPLAGMEVMLDAFDEYDLATVLFSENPGFLLQVENSQHIRSLLADADVAYTPIARVNRSGQVSIRKDEEQYQFEVEALRDVWMRTSFLLDQKQTKPELAKARYENYKLQPLQYSFPATFTGKLSQYNLKGSQRPKAAIIREKGVNGDREMAYAMFLAGFDVKDVHITDLVAGREDLSDVNFVVYVGGFSNSDVLGSAKGWAGAFLYNEKARKALDNFYARPDTLSLGVCNGCQLMIELGLVTPSHEAKPKMLHNASGKFESCFVNMSIQPNHSVMLRTLAGARLGVWVAHGEGQFSLPYEESRYHIAGKYSYEQYPGNPNGSRYATAALASDCGRHLAMMPHLERSLFPWNWAHYPEGRADEASPWIEAFVNAREWIEKR